ncbi:hypothetical protein [Pendulispora albinea]|uniref:Uncharacterized protein n=1 Tax=Pendulispora albinea TaxID=2741071 RepID=A0ABZ2LWQ5_9BACT
MMRERGKGRNREHAMRSFLVALGASLGLVVLLTGCPEKDDKAEAAKAAPQASQAAPAAAPAPHEKEKAEKEKEKGGW